jgi:hypothetical protein
LLCSVACDLPQGARHSQHLARRSGELGRITSGFRPQLDPVREPPGITPAFRQQLQEVRERSRIGRAFRGQSSEVREAPRARGDAGLRILSLVAKTRPAGRAENGARRRGRQSRAGSRRARSGARRRGRQSRPARAERGAAPGSADAKAGRLAPSAERRPAARTPSSPAARTPSSPAARTPSGGSAARTPGVPAARTLSARHRGRAVTAARRLAPGRAPPRSPRMNGRRR